MIVEVIILAFLFIISLVDLKFKTIPSALTTSIILILLIINSGNLLFGIIALIYSILLLEMDFISGLADIKVMSIIGLTISSRAEILLFIFLVVFLGVAYKIFVKKILKKTHEVAFVPCLFLVYVTLLIIKYQIFGII